MSTKTGVFLNEQDLILRYEPVINGDTVMSSPFIKNYAVAVDQSRQGVKNTAVSSNEQYFPLGEIATDLGGMTYESLSVSYWFRLTGPASHNYTNWKISESPEMNYRHRRGQLLRIWFADLDYGKLYASIGFGFLCPFYRNVNGSVNKFSFDNFGLAWGLTGKKFSNGGLSDYTGVYNDWYQLGLSIEPAVGLSGSFNIRFYVNGIQTEYVQCSFLPWKHKNFAALGQYSFEPLSPRRLRMHVAPGFMNIGGVKAATATNTIFQMDKYGVGYDPFSWTRLRIAKIGFPSLIPANGAYGNSGTRFTVPNTLESGQVMIYNRLLSNIDFAALYKSTMAVH